MTFSRIILAALVLGWVLLVGCLEWRHFQGQSHYLIREKTIAGKSTAADLARRLEKTLSFYHSVPVMLSQDPLVLDALTGGDCRDNDPLELPESTATNAPCESAITKVNTLLHRMQSTLGPDLIWVMDTNGVCLASSDAGQTNSGVGDHFADREYFRQARQFGQAQQYAVGHRVHTPGLFFADRVMQSGHFVGEVAIKLNMDHLNDCLDLPDAFLVDGYGVVVLAGHPALLLQALPSAQVGRLTEQARLDRYRLTQFPILSLVPWHQTNSANLILFNHEEPPQLLFSHVVTRQGLRVYVPEPLPALLTLPRDDLAYFALMAIAGSSLILFLGASYNYSRQQQLTNRRLRNQTGLLMDAERIARLGSWNCELPSGGLQLSEQAAEIFQVPPGQATGTHARFADLAVPEDHDRVRQAIESALQTGEPCDLEYQLSRPDDGQTFIHLQGRLVTGPPGQPRRLVGTVQDITSRKRVDREAVHTVSLLKATLESTTDGILVVARAGKITSYTQRFLKLWQMPLNVITTGQDEVALKHVLSQLSDPGEFLAKVQELYQNPRAESFDLLKFTDGRIFERISKPQLIEGQPVGRVWSFYDVTERKRTEQELFKSREALMMVLNNIPQRVYWKNRDLVFEGCNLPFARDCGLSDPAQVIGKTDFDLASPTDAEKFRALDREVMDRNQPKLNFEVTNTRPDGRPAYLLLSKLPLHDQDGQVTGVLGAFDDITARKLLEDQLRHAQKMEAIGRLAGGIAHDFNNLLTVICGYSEMLLLELPPEDTSRDALTEIRKAGDRAAALTRKLLAFSRKQVLEPDVLDLNTLVSDCENMFRRLLGEDILLTVNLAPNLGQIKADASQVDQVLLNLVINARDAMPRGGRLEIATAASFLTEADRQPNEELIPGKYVSLTVSDTGCGMDDLTILHIFEPFFTTKEQGKGTGLGLAMIFGFIKQSGGHISVSSEVGRGSIFRIYLPEFAEPLE